MTANFKINNSVARAARTDNNRIKRNKKRRAVKNGERACK